MEKTNNFETCKLMKKIVDSLTFFVSVDTEGKITYIAEEYAKNLHTTPDEAIGKPVEDIIHNTQMRTVLETGIPQLNYFSSKDDDGEEWGTIVSRRPIFDDGKIIGAMGYTVLQPYEDYNSLDDDLLALRKITALYSAKVKEVDDSHNGSAELLGKSPETAKLRDMIKRVASSNATICILGETGTGKELVAQSIQKLSSRADKPFVKINCAAIPSELFESEVFGYEAGSFTGAARGGKFGKFELADGGTILLDEIGEFPLHLQSKLLRVLQEGEIERIGSTKPKKINVRVLCSTNRDLRQMVDEGKFRADLYFRISTIEINVPPLRDRIDDIPMLCDHFINKINSRDHLAVHGINLDVMKSLKEYEWPGNIRELQHCIERACILCERGELDVEHFDSRIISPNCGKNDDECAKRGLQAELDSIEKSKIKRALAECEGNKAEAAKVLGIHRSLLYRKLEKYGLQ